MRIPGSAGFASRSKMTANASLASTKTPRTQFLRLLGSHPGEREHGMHQRVGAGGAVGLRRVLQLVVADAILAGNEDHCRGHDIGKVAGVMPGAGGDATVTIAERLGGVLDCVDEFGVEDRWRFAPDRLERNLYLAPLGNLGDRVTQILVDRIERLR